MAQASLSRHTHTHTHTHTQIIEQFTKLIKSTLKSKQRSQRSKYSSTFPRNTWFDKECKEAKRKLRKITKKYNQDPNNDQGLLERKESI